MSSSSLLFCLSLCIMMGGTGWSEGMPGYTIAENSVSPDHRFGVAVPIVDQIKYDADPKNRLVEIRTGRVLATIDADTGWSHRLNHIEILPARWSTDSSLLLWEVAGKWSPWALVLLKTEKGAVEWQVNILTIAQQALLASTRKAAPKQYAIAKEVNKGSGRAFPDGFTIDVKVLDPIAFPIHVRADLTSNPKQIEGHSTLRSHLEGSIDESGRFTLVKFSLDQSN